MNGDDWPLPNLEIDYDKGENRRKHVGVCESAEIRWEDGKQVGKCPQGFTREKARDLVQSAIPEYRRTQPDRPCRLWSYHDGAVYAARTSDGGTTWHGYPAQNPPHTIQRKLTARAHALGEDSQLKKWLKRKW